MAGIMDDKLPIEKAYRLEKQQTEQAWLIDSMWARAAVGIIGGAPKCCKSWLGLDMAVSVASGSACLDRFVLVIALSHSYSWRYLQSLRTDDIGVSGIKR